ncbi:GlxA family transcriptional regulator [Jidongwangia harbinensis]|uniref:GlxA family transcriptional regulator n=1 Tax=Jidongwangia harbinensis TaxID=2878561 RepID=UPI001CD944B4|nr:helix-turn-helix domain-containing protein [Jidongwangia harbinensis]MCA2211557.1 helix-turn-helix domain-containing protein [Jidongwangia harbinensis]
MIASVAAVVIDRVEPFELGVLCEVFGIDRTVDGVAPIDFRVCGEQPGVPVRSSVCLEITPRYGLDALADADVVAIPACAVRDTYPPAVLAALREAAARGATLLSICNGAFLLGQAGLLDGRKCTTHWRYAAEFRRRFPSAVVDPDVLFVDDGNVVTSAGTAAGIDACLYLVRRDMGARTAMSIARCMVAPPQRDGGQRQFIDLPIPDADGGSLRLVLSWMLETINVDHSVAALARRANMSERTFARRFVAETGTTPHKWLTLQRVLHARTLLEETRLSMEEVARQCGFGTGALLRHHFQRTVGITPAGYRRNFCHGDVVVTG